MSNGLTKEDVLKFDQKLKFYCWPVCSNFQETDLNRLEKAENFNQENYDEAVSIYIYWRNNILPTVADEEKDSFHICFGQQVYNILCMFAADHHIHLALQCWNILLIGLNYYSHSWEL